ncbi:Hypothetical predicted protein [Mytilus galloprovincialis]|uniref:Uncharacterized protein n=1 Tax=Mytilus galloprovincialis TaxID=29158 RepID=A0A8B6FBX7_MYTGA|nr:Hypothetical predicted protein [Mytilus galloprovincialis]
MFKGKINESNNTILLRVLGGIQSGGIDGLIMNLFPTDNRSLLVTSSESSSTMLDFLFYRIDAIQARETEISISYKKLAFIESLIKSESSTFIVDVCKYYYAQNSQIIAQLLPPPNTKGSNYIIHKCYQRHLQDGTKTGAVSGWLLYASFYYVTGQFNVTLRLMDYVLSRCSPDMMLSNDFACKIHINCYRQNIHSTMTLIERMNTATVCHVSYIINSIHSTMTLIERTKTATVCHVSYIINSIHSTMTLIERTKTATVCHVSYIINSSLIPEERQLEVKDQVLFIPPTVMSHCLRFLCFHHLGDILNRQQSLRDLYLTVKDTYLVPKCELSNSITIVGVCFEMSGAKDKAYQCYEEALKVDDHKTCRSAKIRKSKLDGNYCGLG